MELKLSDEVLAKLSRRAEIELDFCKQFGKLNRREGYWDGRSDGAWLAWDLIKRFIDGDLPPLEEE